ncbi:MAG: phage scaffolding protein [Eubacteriales bacterium]|nr:phage scaffolding protein [Eubacteriales bacterium]
MTKESLMKAGLTEEQADSIMSEIDSDYVAKTDYNAQADKLKLAEEKVQTTEEALKKFDGVDVEGLKKQVSDLQDDLQKKDTEYQQKITDMAFDSALDAAISAANGKNAKAIRALMDIDTLKASKNQQEDMRTAVAQIAKENDYLFGDISQPHYNPPKGGKPNAATDMASALAEHYNK